MNEQKLAEIQHRVTKQRVTFNDVTDLIQALRDERQKVAELQNWFDISQNKLTLSEKTISRLREEIQSLRRQL